jgi:hypothetical protein
MIGSVVLEPAAMVAVAVTLTLAAITFAVVPVKTAARE